MAKIVGYIATSLDGMIADKNDSLDWLFAYDGMDLGAYDYNKFLKRIQTVVMGRGTYDFVANQPSEWPYHGKRVFVVTSRPIDNPVGDIEVRSEIGALISELRAFDDGDVWMLGGGKLQMAFIEREALDEIEIYIMPEMLGGGTPLFPQTGFRGSPTLISTQMLDRGCVRLHYRFSPTG
ncbi:MULTISPECIES: dihydrofolate reductase family protein [unclassified Thalassospira]|uniref:dihydrofolate reductase family protein n=1 Tax=unclassified Thalassospira TaxID=2648997 RepID=UPI000EDAFA86|nr:MULTISPECIES: dihydrofolate reductase family protein [unclassified Thalassospira]HAI29763.1 dihydrofolate reductase [Thalassospira sp.]|tara:strand:+ start:526 stop:1062 length:537 start_codon:yes stop_codon:yes gene_type:complete